MPANKGRCPPHDKVDIKLRNGMVIRDIDPKGWRWKEWEDGPHNFDIVIWQPAGVLKEWRGKK